MTTLKRNKMKTNQLMIRKMGEFDVTQRTSDSFFNASQLLDQWCNVNDRKKNINHFLELSTTKEFINEIINRSPDIRNHEKPENEVIRKTKCTTLSNGRKIAGSYWFCPFLFIDFAMWINPSFKYDVLKFVYDEMIKYRNESGDNYQKLMKSIIGMNHNSNGLQIIGDVATAMNYIVFNSNRKMIRNEFGNEDKQRELSQLEDRISMLINDGFIKNNNELIEYLRKLWQKKYQPNIFK